MYAIRSYYGMDAPGDGEALLGVQVAQPGKMRLGEQAVGEMEAVVVRGRQHARQFQAMQDSYNFV